MTDAIAPFRLSVPQSELDDLKARLARTRWPDSETVDDTSRGPPLTKIRALVDRWQGGYDWRRCEALLNAPTTPQPDAAVEPDLFVPTTACDIAAGRDPQMEAATLWLSRRLG